MFMGIHLSLPPVLKPLLFHLGNTYTIFLFAIPNLSPSSLLCSVLQQADLYELHQTSLRFW